MTTAEPNGRPRRSASIAPKPSPGFIVPCAPTPVVRPPGGAGWIHEVLNDGYRLIARRCADGINLWNCHATDMAARFERIAAAIDAISVRSVTLDGEAMVALANGKEGSSEFAPPSDAQSRRAVMIAFDVLEMNGKDLRSKPLRHRRAILAELLADTSDDIVFSEAFVEDGEVAFRQARDTGFKGIVSKRIDRPYQSGSSADWVRATHRRFWSPPARPVDPQIGFWH